MSSKDRSARRKHAAVIKSPKTPPHSTAEYLVPVLQTAAKVIGDESGAMRWLGTPVRALDYATPISLLTGPEGRDAVLSVLSQLEHGIF
jgi:putative toxin-antitoxin system antitoxin component (TIGR02293 family)